jgi:RNA polymerase sigma factor (sigma-70 family)
MEWMLSDPKALSGGFTHPEFGGNAGNGGESPDSADTAGVQNADRHYTRILLGHVNECLRSCHSLTKRSSDEALKPSSRTRYAADAARQRRRAVDLLMHLIYPVQRFDPLLRELDVLAGKAAPLLRRLEELPTRSGVANDRLDSTLRSLARRRHPQPGEPDVEQVRHAAAEHREILAGLAAIRKESGFAPEKLESELRRAREGRRIALRARDEIVTVNHGLAVRKAMSRYGSRMPRSDLEQEAHVGLVIAAEKYDYRRGCRFSTYASWWILQTVLRAEARQDQFLHVSQKARKRFRDVLSTRRTFQLQHNREPTQEELLDVLKCDAKKLNAVLQAMRDPYSLHDPVGGDDTSLEELIPDPRIAPPVSKVVCNDILGKAREAAKELTDREHKIAILRFPVLIEPGDPLRQKQMPSDDTAERIRQIEAEAIRHLLGDGKK